MQSSSRPPGGHALADILPLKVTKFGGRVLHEHGHVGIGDLVWFLISSPQRLFEGRLNPSHYGTRALMGLGLAWTIRRTSAGIEVRLGDFDHSEENLRTSGVYRSERRGRTKPSLLVFIDAE